MTKKYILFICKQNTFRSVIAEAFYNSRAKTYTAVSAGMKKADAINPYVTPLMKEKNINITKTPQLYTFDMLKNAVKVITFGCEGGVCLPFPAEEWHVDDAEAKSLGDCRRIRDEIEQHVNKLLDELEGDK